MTGVSFSRRALQRACLLVAVVMFTAACGGGTTGVTPPTPTPTPTTGTVTGTVTVVAAAASRAAGQPVPALPLRSAPQRPAYVPDQFMVKFRAGTPAASANSLHAQTGATVLRTIGRLDVQVVRIRRGVDSDAALAAYRASGIVQHVERDGYAYRTAEPNDPFYANQWHYPQIGLPSAWNLTTGGAVVVAVLDTGIRTDHPDITTAVTVAGYDFVSRTDNGDGDGRDADPTDPGCPDVDPTDTSHGTHVSGTVAARTNNGIGVAGVNWGGVSATKIMPLRVLGQWPSDPPNPATDCGVGTYSDIIDAIYYAADHGAKVINMSLGGSNSDLFMDQAIAYARERGVTLVASAGNDSCGPVLYPARHHQVIAVGATTITNARASYSNCGPEIDVVAPGGSSGAGVLSTTWSPAGGYVYQSSSGTSMAAPHVSGLVALLISRGVTGPATIQSVLQSTATCLPPGGTCPNSEFGHGLVNAAAAVSDDAVGSRLRAFSGVFDGSSITDQSDVVNVQASGAFTITRALPGTMSVFAWQDSNRNGTVDNGDYYGRTDGVVIVAGATTSGVAVTAQLYSGPPIRVMRAGTTKR